MARSTPVRLCAAGLDIPAGLGFEDWASTGRKLSGIVDSSAWWLGDWLVFGKAHYADSYQLAIDSAGLSYQTLRNYAWVARRFSFDRRRADLTFKHHAEVASLPPEDQDRLLDEASSEGWTTKQLRNAIQRGRCLPDSTSGATERSRIELPSRRVGLWRDAAEQAGVDFDAWVLNALDSAAGCSDAVDELPVGALA